MPYPVLIDGASISTPYGGLDALPTSYFVDRNGKVVAAQLGLTPRTTSKPIFARRLQNERSNPRSRGSVPGAVSS